MIFTQEEMMTILKKALPGTNYKELSNIATSIIGEAGQWQEVDLNEHLHDDLRTKVLHDLCRRESNSQPPRQIRLFFKE